MPGTYKLDCHPSGTAYCLNQSLLDGLLLHALLHFCPFVTFVPKGNMKINKINKIRSECLSIGSGQKGQNPQRQSRQRFMCHAPLSRHRTHPGQKDETPPASWDSRHTSGAEDDRKRNPGKQAGRYIRNPPGNFMGFLAMQ